MDSYTVIVVIFGIIILLLLVGVFFINRLSIYNNKVKSSLVTVSGHLEARMELIDQMINFINNNLEHEKSYVTKLKHVDKYIKEFLEENSNFKGFSKNEKEFLNFIRLDENYSFLKKNKEYLKLKEEVLANQERLVYALDSYDKGVVDYNNYRSNKFILFLSKLFGFPEYDCYSK